MSRAAYERDPRWQRAMTLTVEVYRLTRAFPADEKSGLAATLRRLAATIPLRIAEATDAAAPAPAPGSDTAEAEAWSATHDLLRDLDATLLICRRLGLVGWFALRHLRAAIARLDDAILDALDDLADEDDDADDENLRLAA